jgi:prophage regulatory protein
MVMKILRIRDTLERTGLSRTPLYEGVASGLFTRPIKVGGSRAAGWPEHEVAAVVSARVAGAPDVEVRALVERLHDERRLRYLKTVERHMVPASSGSVKTDGVLA